MALTKAQLIDLNANELIIDLDADTSITADTDDQIDIKIAGADDFRFTANTFTALAGSSIVVPASGLTIGSTAVTSTAAELNLIDGGASTGTTAVADADGIITNDGGTMRLTTAATFKTYFQEGISTAYDDLTAGDAAVNITTSSGNITIDAAANDSDIIFKGTDNSADITMLTLDGSAAGEATFNAGIVIPNDGNIGSASDKDAIAIPANGIVTFSAGFASGNLTFSGQELDLSSGDFTIDVAGDIILNADGGDIKFADASVDLLSITNSSSDVVLKPLTDAKDIIFQQYDGTEVARIEDNATFNVVTGKLAINGTAITSTAAEFNLIEVYCKRYYCCCNWRWYI